MVDSRNVGIKEDEEQKSTKAGKWQIEMNKRGKKWVEKSEKTRQKIEQRGCKIRSITIGKIGTKAKPKWIQSRK